MRIPLAERARPQTIDEIVGQRHLLSPGSAFRNMLESDRLQSCIFWGNPGVGKTSLAHLVAHYSKKDFYPLSASKAGVREVREIIEKIDPQQGALLFIDEIHRFNKGQQDALLDPIEKGIITLIGATTENPSFEINNALLSRTQIFILHPLEEEDLLALLHRLLQTDTELKALQIQLEETDALFKASNMDARKMLNLIELLIAHADPKKKIIINNEQINKILHSPNRLYDKHGDFHYDIISVFIKSIRGSDPDAAIYWLARMLDGGEDIIFIARRLLILAAEDIGLANPNALLLANASFDAVHKIGMPEARIILAECVIYLACSEKSNSAYVAITKGMKSVQQNGNLPVPLHLRNAPTSLMKNLNYGKDYQYAHNFENHFVIQDYLPEAIKKEKFYSPATNSKENAMQQFLRKLWGDKK